MNFLTGKFLDRRALLRGSCAALGLPLLSAMTPALGRAGTPALRLVFVYLPNGVIGDGWRIERQGPLRVLPQSLAPLQPLASDLAVLSGLAHDKGRANGDGPGDHARAAGSWLTACQPYKGDGTRLSVGVSVDQVAARRLGRQTRLPSLVLGAEGGRLSGQCDSGYPCSYSNTVSWRTAHTPLPKLTDPGRLFDQLVGDLRPGEDALERARRLARRQSVLDLVREDTRRLARTLGTGDRVKLDEYLSALRATEKRLERLAQAGPNLLADTERPDNQDRNHAERTALLFELLALALENDTTRVATLMIGNEGSNRSYPALDVREGHHGLSHHKGDKHKIASLRRINRHHIELVAPFIQRLASAREDDSALLQRCAVVIGSGISDGNRHFHHDLPLLIAGQLGGAIGTGEHRRHPSQTPMANLFLSLLDSVGVHEDRLGDSTGRLDLHGSI